MTQEVKIGLCKFCAHHMCQMKAIVEDGQLVKLLNFPESPFTPPWTTEGCPKNRAVPELLKAPGRTCYPLKRKGARGEGKWEKIEWDQALDEISERLGEIRERYGAEAVATITGGINEPWALARFFNLFGSPNISNVNAPVCSGLESLMNIICLGGVAHYGPPTKIPKCFVMWGGEHWTSLGIEWKTEGQAEKVIVVNSTGSPQAKKATVWLQPRPGTDTALGLGWLNVIINEKLYNREFVEKWTFGFDKLRERVNEFPPGKVEKITWVPKEKIIQAARIYATSKPAAIAWGTATGHIGRNAAEVERVRIALRAITGNIDIDGGNHFIRPHSKLVSIREMSLDEMLPVSQYRKQLAADKFRALSWRCWEILPDKKSLRAFVIRGSIFTALIHSIRTGEPYRVRAVLINGCNPLVTVANSRNVYDGLKHHIDLSVCMETFMTPTAMLADYVLPITFWPERPAINHLGDANSVIVGQRLVPKSAPGLYDRRDDYDIWRGLGIRLGQEAYWPWSDLDEAQDYRLENFGMSLDEFAWKKGHDTEPVQFKSYEKGGFRTPTGKVELWSTIFESLGYDPLPHYEEPPESPISRSDLTKEYPYILINNPMSKFFVRSQLRQSKSLRSRHSEPFVTIHPSTAEKHGIREGDMVWIENRRGRIRQKARLSSDTYPEVVAADFGWWFPEKPGPEPSLYGVWDANINILTSDSMDHACEVSGSWYLKPLLCRIYRAKE